MTTKPKQPRKRQSPTSALKRTRRDLALCHPRQEGESTEDHLTFLRELLKWIEDGKLPKERKPSLAVDNTKGAA